MPVRRPTLLRFPLKIFVLTVCSVFKMLQPVTIWILSWACSRMGMYKWRIPSCFSFQFTINTSSGPEFRVGNVKNRWGIKCGWLRIWLLPWLKLFGMLRIFCRFKYPVDVVACWVLLEDLLCKWTVQWLDRWLFNIVNHLKALPMCHVVRSGEMFKHRRNHSRNQDSQQKPVFEPDNA
jgi:hypothetical protein